MTDDFQAAPTDIPTIPDGPPSVDWQTVATDETNPAAGRKRRGRPPRDPNAPPTTRKPRASSRGKSIKDQIVGTLFMFNLAFMFMPDPFRGDALDELEIEALADALDKTAQTNPTIHRALTTVMVDGGAIGELAIVGALIAGRRLARHGMIPGEMDERLGTFLAVKSGNAAA